MALLVISIVLNSVDYKILFSSSVCFAENRKMVVLFDFANEINSQENGMKIYVRGWLNCEWRINFNLNFKLVLWDSGDCRLVDEYLLAIFDEHLLECQRWAELAVFCHSSNRSIRLWGYKITNHGMILVESYFQGCTYQKGWAVRPFPSFFSIEPWHSKVPCDWLECIRLGPQLSYELSSSLALDGDNFHKIDPISWTCQLLYFVITILYCRLDSRHCCERDGIWCKKRDII